MIKYINTVDHLMWLLAQCLNEATVTICKKEHYNIVNYLTDLTYDNYMLLNNTYLKNKLENVWKLFYGVDFFTIKLKDAQFKYYVNLQFIDKNNLIINS